MCVYYSVITSVILTAMLRDLESPKKTSCFADGLDGRHRGIVSKHWTTSRDWYLCKRQPLFCQPLTWSKLFSLSTDRHTPLSTKQLDGRLNMQATRVATGTTSASRRTSISLRTWKRETFLATVAGGMVYGTKPRAQVCIQTWSMWGKLLGVSIQGRHFHPLNSSSFLIDIEYSESMHHCQGFVWNRVENETHGPLLSNLFTVQSKKWQARFLARSIGCGCYQMNRRQHVLSPSNSSGLQRKFHSDCTAAVSVQTAIVGGAVVNFHDRPLV